MNLGVVGQLLIAGLLALGTPANSGDHPPKGARAKEVVALVDKASVLIAKNGKTAFTQFRKRGSEWFHGDSYVFVYDMDGKILLNPAFPKREGISVIGERDANGKLFHQEIIKMAQTRGSGWVDYMFARPGQTEPSLKWAYVKKVTIDGTPGLVASGFYLNN